MPFFLLSSGNHSTKGGLPQLSTRFEISPKKTYKINVKKRSDFTIAHIEKFLSMLDGEYIGYKKVNGKKLRYECRIDSPIPGKHFKKQYIMVFETDFEKPHLINTITLFAGW